jgi:hypothetical protein
LFNFESKDTLFFYDCKQNQGFFMNMLLNIFSPGGFLLSRQAPEMAFQGSTPCDPAPKKSFQGSTPCDLPPKKSFQGSTPCDPAPKKSFEGSTPCDLAPKKSFEGSTPCDLPLRAGGHCCQHANSLCPDSWRIKK